MKIEAKKEGEIVMSLKDKSMANKCLELLNNSE